MFYLYRDIYNFSLYGGSHVLYYCGNGVLSVDGSCAKCYSKVVASRLRTRFSHLLQTPVFYNSCNVGC